MHTYTHPQTMQFILGHGLLMFHIGEQHLVFLVKETNVVFFFHQKTLFYIFFILTYFWIVPRINDPQVLLLYRNLLLKLHLGYSALNSANLFS